MHTAWEYPPLVYGGLGRHVHALAVAQVAAGHEVVVVTQRVPDAPADEVVEGVRVVREASTPDIAFVPENLIRWVCDLDTALAVSATRVVSSWLPDVVHCHDWMTTRAGVSAAAAADCPLVATIHATERGRHQGHLPGEISLTVDAVERFLSHEATRVITCSNAMRREVREQFGPTETVRVIPNGIDTDVWSTTAEAREQARAKWAPAEGPLLVFTGRLEVEKGIMVLVAAMAMVRERVPSARLVMAGTGGQTEAVVAACERWGVEDSVTLAGWLPEDELRALIAAADVAVVPSLYEPFGLVALEAMSLGTPVVAAASGGLADVVRDPALGWSVPPGDSAALAAALTAAVTDPTEARVRSERASGALRTDYDWAAIAARTVEVYREVTT